MLFRSVNPEEDFTDKWDSEPQYYVEFKRFIKHLSEEWEKLKGSINEDELDVILKGLIGESVYNRSKELVNNTFNTVQKQIVDPYAGLKKLAQPVTSEHKMWFSK